MFVFFSSDTVAVVVVVLQSNLNRLIHQFDDWLSVVSMKAHVFVLNGPNGATSDTVGGGVVVVVGSFFFGLVSQAHRYLFFSNNRLPRPPPSSTFIPPPITLTHMTVYMHIV